MKRLLRKLFPSLFPATEYVCSSAEGLPCMLKCVAVVDGKRVDFEKQPLFLGYKPLVMGVCVSAEQAEEFAHAKKITLTWQRKDPNAEVARVEMAFDKRIPLGDTELLLLTGISSSQKFETGPERLAFKLNQWLSKKSEHNIDLTPSEYDQLKIAYGIPREIRMVTVCSEKGCNTFPIDLFGAAGKNHFVLSLRHQKKSCQQVEQVRSMTSRIMFGKYAPFAYFLGRCHSMDWHKAVIPPDQAGKEEFSLTKVIGDYGVHRLLLFSRTSPRIDDSPEKLVHVHRAYANWHKRQGFPLKEIPH